MTNPTDPAALEAWEAAHDVGTVDITCGDPECKHCLAAAAVIQSYGDQREAAARADERERVADRIAELEAVLYRIDRMSDGVDAIERATLYRTVKAIVRAALRDAGGA